ncbi:WAS/WASL-interacting protein family member 3-like [Balaenoptera acutorostrata]|uniref:WAS/WASL-interacting protein family member 3-like n=1 Tax=Balaenoptera acutorostrata TaxID=9767 RepID=A0ABM3SV01_BALAC|nr:WAS/WASL-interacting protein family member 3-like [Balaenoptera acutorostrata]
MPRSPPPQPRPPGLPPPLRLAPHPTSSSGSPRLKSLPEKRHLNLTLHREAEPPSCAAPRSPFWATHGGGGLRRGPEGEWGEGRKRKPSARVVEKKSPAVESHSRSRRDTAFTEWPDLHGSKIETCVMLRLLLSRGEVYFLSPLNLG